MALHSRRQFIAGAVAAGSWSVAGCLDGKSGQSECVPGRSRHDSDVTLDEDASWPTYQYDAANTGWNPTASGVSGDAEIAWRYSACTEAESGVIVQGGRAYAGGMRIDATSGKALGGDWHGHMSTPTVADGTLYVSAFDLRARDAASGETLWTFETDGSAGAIPASTVSGETVYVPGNLDDPTLYAVDAAAGNERWRFEADAEIDTPPAVAGETAYVVDESNTVYAVDAATGDERWRRSVDVSIWRAAPVVADGMVFFGSTTGEVLALDADDGAPAWRRQVAREEFEIESPVAVADGTVFAAGRSGMLVALDAATGSPEWRTTADVVLLGAPAVANGVVHVGAASESGRVFAFDAATGEERWQVETRSVSFGDYTRGGVTVGPAVAGDHVYVATAPGDVYAFAGE